MSEENENEEPSDTVEADQPQSDDEHEPEQTDDETADTTSDQENAMSQPETSTTSQRQYDFDEEIGSGAFGTVYKGRDDNLERVVAIKKIRSVFDVFAQLEREDVVERFRRLTRAQAQISHPSIVQIYDVETSEEYPFAVTEYAPNGNLRSRIEDDEKRQLSYALETFVQILHGVHAAHERDLVHGNIKPENVVFDAAGNAKLSDFGITTIVELDEAATDQISVAVGAPEYKAPEQVKSGETGSARSDIYGLGILFYEMLTGEIPSRRSPMPSEKHAEIPGAIDDIFDRMSLDDPEDRYASIEDVLADLYSSEKIVRLMDRRTGVVHLADPVEHGRRPAVDSDAHLRAATEGSSLSPLTAESGESDESDASDLSEKSEETDESDEFESVEVSEEAEESRTAADGGSASETWSTEDDDGSEDEEDEDIEPEPIEEEKGSWGLF